MIIQATVQGHDHGRLLDALRQYPDRFRAVAVPHPDITDTELSEMHALGVRGVRVAMAGTGLVGDDARGRFNDDLIARVAELGWHLQLFCRGIDLLDVKEKLIGLPTEFVIDHLGLVRPDEGVEGSQFRTLLELLDSGRGWVKLSGPMRVSRQREMPYDDTLPLYQALARHNPERLVWGSDWPHIHYNQGVMPNDGDLLDLLLDWAPDAALRQRILVDNPRTLYDTA